MKQWKKSPVIRTLGLFLLALELLSACATKELADYSHSTIVVQVEQVKGAQITAVLGQWSEEQPPMENGGELEDKSPKEAVGQAEQPDGVRKPEVAPGSFAAVVINDAVVTTDVRNGNGIFSYGKETMVTISDSIIRTSGEHSGGLQTTGGGTTLASGLDIETQGHSSVAIRSDRGGGKVKVQGGTYVTHGTGSPAIYSTAEISASDAVLTANGSEAIVVEGKNSVTLHNCQVTGNMSGTYGDAGENLHAVMIYQSMSGDAEVGQASLAMTDGSLTALSGDLFYVTNTSCSLYLSQVSLRLANNNLLTVAGNDGSRGWGQTGANGGQVSLIADNQSLNGVMMVDEISQLALTLEQGSIFTGAINPDGKAGVVSVTLNDAAQWQLTADSYIMSLEGSAAQVVSNGHHLYVGNERLI